MSLEPSDVVDYVAVDRATGDAVLYVFDEGTWDDAENHASLLEQKLNAYLRFIEGGELAAVMEGREYSGRVRIKIECKFAPPPAVTSFLNDVRDTLFAAGYGFVIEHRP